MTEAAKVAATANPATVAAAVAVLVAVVSWLTFALLQLDRDEVQARRQAAILSSSIHAP